jgi:tetratricopeptide (TPR) repeat protein
MLPDVFISYGREDDTNEFVERLHDDLESNGFGAWLDRRDIRPSDDWDAHVQAGLDNCSMLLFVVTPKSLTSEVCRAEWNRVLSAGKRVLPLMLGHGLSHDSLPFRLQLRQWIDFRHGYTEALLELLAFLRKLEVRTGELRTTQERQVAVPVAEEPNLEKASALIIREAEDMPGLPMEFVVRADLQDTIQPLLETNKQVLLQGYGGVGKTSLAARVAADHIQAHHHPVLWLYAGDEGADALLEALAYPFNRHQEINRERSAARPQLIKQILRENKIGLVVVDDMWNEKALPTLLEAVPRSIPVLFTSRQRYTLAGTIVPVGELSPPGALRMLEIYANRTFGADEAAQAAAICEQVGYHAFALEIAGRILQVDEISPAVLLEQVKGAPHDLEMPEGLAIKGRTSVWDLITRSLLALDDETRAVFLAIGALFAPRVTPHLLAMVMGHPDEQIDAALKTLQRRALVERVDPPPDDQPYYRFHALSFTYARQIYLNKKSGFESSLNICRHYAEQHAEDVPALHAELGNLLGAVALASQQPPHHQIAVDIMKVLAVDYLSARGHTEYFRQMLDVAITLSREQVHARCMDLFVLVAKRGNTHAHQGDLQATFGHYHEAYELAHLIKETGKEILALSEIGALRADMPDAADAEDYLERAQALAENFEDGCWLGRVFLNRGYVARRRDDLTVARDNYAKAVENAERCDDEVVLFFALSNLGTTERELGHPELARSYHERALQMALNEQSRSWEAQANQSLGEDEHAVGHHDDAKTHLKKARELFREIENKAKENETIDFMRQAGYPIIDQSGEKKT